MDHPGTMPDVVEVGDIFCSPTGQMVEGMVTYRMAGIEDLVKYIRILADIIPDAEESGFGMKRIKGGEYPRGHLWNGPVIEGEEDLLLLTRHFPDQSWK